MKTKFQRVLSVILCMILVLSTMSVMAFATDESEYDFKTYQENATKENIHYLMDVLDEVLMEGGMRKEISLLDPIPFILPDGLKIVIDITSIDATLDTLDNFRTPLSIVLGLGSIGNILGDLSSLNLSVLESDLTRAEDGDVKIFREIVEFAAANGALIGKFIDGSLDLGKLGELTGISMDALFEGGGISTVVKEVFVGMIYEEDTPEFNAALTKAKADFDAFIYEDFIANAITADGGMLEGLVIEETTTVNNIITQCFNIFIEDYVIPTVGDLSYDFSDLGAEYAGLNDKIILDGDYDFEGIIFKNSVLNEINNVLGLIFAQLVPDYTGWVQSADYTIIGANMEGLVRYIAEESGFIDNVDSLSNEALMVEVLKVVFAAADQNGEKEIYERIKDATSMAEVANNIAFQLAAEKYSYDEDEATYEHVLGDVVIDYVDDVIPLYDEKGNAVTVGSGKTIWEVLNYAMNFYFVDKGMAALIGIETDKADTFFEKLDMLLDYTANDGDANFDSEAYFTALLDSVFTIDLQTFVNLTAAKALNFAGNVTAGTFLYNTIFNILNNWTGADKSVALTRHEVKPFHNTVSNEGLAVLVRVMLDTLSSRSESLATFIGIILGIIEPIYENVSYGQAPTCTAAGKANAKTCPNEICGHSTFVTNYNLPATGHHEKVERTKDATCTANGEDTYTCVVCDNVRKVAVPKHGHTLDAGRQTKAPTCTTEGVWTYKCTRCGVDASTKSLPALGHKKDGGSVTKAPTCTAKGTKTYKCTVCSTVLSTEEIAAKGHTPDSKAVVTKTPTCSEEGLRSYKCVACKVSVKDEVMAKTNHTSDSGKVTKAATYEAEGEKVYSCTVCKTVLRKETLKKLTLSKVTGITSTTSTAKASTYTWDKVEGATGYVVQYTTNNGITWNTLNVTTNSVTIKGLKSGAQIKIKVTAKAGKVKGAASSNFVTTVNAAKKPAKVKIKTLKSAAAKKAVVTWTALKGISGYEVMYSTSKKFKKDTKVKNVKAKAKKVTLKKLKSGKKYFVKMRAFTKVNGKKVYGAYSKVMKVKVK